MNATTPLHELDLERIVGETIDPPEAFKAAVYTGDEMMQLLGVDDFSVFWHAVAHRLIISPVYIPTSNGPMPLWEKEFTDRWIAEGCPPDLVHLAHQKMLHNKLLSAVGDELPHNPPRTEERN